MVVAAAIIGAAATIGGGVLGNVAAKKEASKNRDWQAAMSSSAYQRAMEDMRIAGLNPMLAYSQGPASTPSGSVGRQGDFGGAAAGNIIAQSRLRSSSAKAVEQQEKYQKEQTSTETERARLEKMRADDYAIAGDSITGRQFITAKRISQSTDRYLQQKYEKATRSSRQQRSFDDILRKKRLQTPSRRQKAPYHTRKIRPGEKAGDYFSKSNRKR